MTTPIPVDDLKPVELGVASARRRTIPHSWIIAFLVIGIIIAAVALNGGFDRRRLVQDLGGPQAVDIGPAIVHLTHATYEVPKEDSTSKNFQVELFGTCQLTVDESFNSGYAIAEAILLPYLDSVWVGEDPHASFTWEGTSARSQLPPGMPPYDCKFRFNVPKDVDTTSGDTLRVVFTDLVYGDRYAVQFGIMSWYPENIRYRVIEIPWGPATP